jgi:hypothetical protein
MKLGRVGKSRSRESTSSSESSLKVISLTTQVHLCLPNQPFALDR